MAKEKARPKRSGDIKLKLGGGTIAALDLSNELATSLDAFCLGDDLQLGDVVRKVVQDEVVVTHGWTHVPATGDPRFAELRLAPL